MKLPASRWPGGRTAQSGILALAFAALLVAAQSAQGTDAPRVVVTSRIPDEGTTRVLGYIEGDGLKSAGIFDHGEKLKDIDVSGASGSQRINFDFAIEAPSPSMTIEATDALGRTASAPVLAEGAETPGGREAERESGEREGAESTASPASGSSGNAEEIQRYGGSTLSNASPRRFPGGVGKRMTGVQISVNSVIPLMSRPGSYEVIGQITGPGVRRAGIYVNGRPVSPIAVSTGVFIPFDVVFALTGGRSASIRAYGAGRDYIELPIDLSGSTTMYSNPYARPPYPYTVDPYRPAP